MSKNQKPTNIPTQPDTNFEDQIQDLKNQLDQANALKIRALADYQNLQTRSEKEKFDFVKFANEKLLLKIIELKDTIDRAEIFITDPGLKIVSDQISSLLKDNGVTEIEIVGKEFDPVTMECVDKNQCDNNLVASVSQKGYQLFDKVIRHAQVTVGQIDLKN